MILSVTMILGAIGISMELPAVEDKMAEAWGLPRSLVSVFVSWRG
jgi:hypothetical protein